MTDYNSNLPKVETDAACINHIKHIAYVYQGVKSERSNSHNEFILFVLSNLDELFFSKIHRESIIPSIFMSHMWDDLISKSKGREDSEILISLRDRCLNSSASIADILFLTDHLVTQDSPVNIYKRAYKVDSFLRH